MLMIREEYCHKQEDETSDNNDEICRIFADTANSWLCGFIVSLRWIRHFTTNLSDTSNHAVCKSSLNADLVIFMDNELHLMNSYTAIPCDDFEDIQANRQYIS
ncbi:hypothetical protein Peur_024893 [Populus x canadensis]